MMQHRSFGTDHFFAFELCNRLDIRFCHDGKSLIRMSHTIHNNDAVAGRIGNQQSARVHRSDHINFSGCHSANLIEPRFDGNPIDFDALFLKLLL